MLLEYKARDKSGQLITDKIEISDQTLLRKELKEKGLILISYQNKSKNNFLKQNFQLPSIFKPKVPLKEVLLFYQQLQTVYSVGIPIHSGLQFIQQYTENPAIKTIVNNLLKDVESGNSLHSSAKKYPDVFSPLAISLLEAGESSGKLDALLEQMTQITEQQFDTKNKIKSALFYPKMILGMIVIVFFALVFFILPKISDFYSRMNIELPLITRSLLGFSSFMISYGWFFVVLLIASIWAIKKYGSTLEGRTFFDRIKLKTPVFGSILLQIEVYNFCMVTSIMLQGGLPLVEVFQIVKQTFSNIILRNDIESALEKIKTGRPIAESLNKGEAFPAFVGNLIAVGEEAGALEKTLLKTANYYKLQVDYKLSNLSKAIEPILLFFVFGIVLVLALAMFLPMWKMTGALRNN